MDVWQIASGTWGRDYSDLLISHDLACLGPGDPGRYPDPQYDSLVATGHLSAMKVGAIRSFAESVNIGDVVLLRTGHTVVAIGVFAEEGYAWDPSLDDVRGWDLQHTRRVTWQDQLAGELADLQHDGPLFGARKQIPMFTRVHDSAVLGPLQDLLAKVSERDLRALPEPPLPPLGPQELGQVLFSQGLSNRATDDVLAALARQQRLLSWYREFGQDTGRPTEHEVVAHMVLPLLLALGWSEQLLAVEWNRVDLAGFSSAPTVAESCSLICEAKGLGHGLDGVLEQARSYAEALGLNSCRRILLTEGGRFYLYEREGQEWSDAPTAYLNVEKPRLRNADSTNAVDLIMKLRQM